MQFPLLGSYINEAFNTALIWRNQNSKEFIYQFYIICRCEFYITDMLKIESLQRKATRLVDGIGHLTYGEQLAWLKLPSLNKRYHGDMVQVFNVIKKNVNLDSSLFFSFSGLPTRGHPFKIYEPMCTKDICQHAFSQRVINSCNSIPVEVIGATSVNHFKELLDTHHAHTIIYN